MMKLDPSSDAQPFNCRLERVGSAATALTPCGNARSFPVTPGKYVFPAQTRSIEDGIGPLTS
jgi:hypothetical protein